MASSPAGGKVRRVADARRRGECCSGNASSDQPLNISTTVCSTIDECSLASSSRDTVCASSMTSRRVTTKCSLDLKLLCRLIGLHARDTIVPGSEVRLNIDGKGDNVLRVVDLADIGCNVRCIILEEPMAQWARRCSPNLRSLDPALGCIDYEGGLHTILAFNWFSPKSLRDYVSLGLQMCNNGELDKHKMVGKVYLEKAEDFLWSPEIIKHLDLMSSLKADFRLVTATGFSLGGAIAHAFAYLLRDVRQVALPMRVVGLGCPRIGSALFSTWYHANVTADSLNVILYDEFLSGKEMLIDYDPVCQNPPLVNDFTFHPNCYMLHKRFGSLRPLTSDEKDFLSQLPLEKLKSSPLMTLMQSITGMGEKERDKDRRWRKLHGVIKYYEAMYGLGED